MALALLTDVEPAEGRRRLVDRRLHLRFVAHVDRERQRAPARLFDFSRGGVDSAFQLGMRIDRLSGDRDIGAIGSGF